MAAAVLCEPTGHEGNLKKSEAIVAKDTQKTLCTFACVGIK